MAPSSQYNRRQFGNDGGNGGENINPQQNNNNYNAYASLTRLAKYTTTTTTTNSNSNTTTNNNNSVESAVERRPTVKITNTRGVQGKQKQQPSAASGFQRKNNKSNNNPMKKKNMKGNSSTGIERSYTSINNTRKSLGGAVVGGGNAVDRNSAGRSGNNNSVGKNSGGGSISSSSYSSFTRHAAATTKKKNTGIERSYDSVTNTLKSVGSLVSGTSNQGSKIGGKKSKTTRVKNRESFRSNEGCGSYLPSNSHGGGSQGGSNGVNSANNSRESNASGMANNSRSSVESSSTSSSSEESSSVDDIFRTTLQNNNTFPNNRESTSSSAASSKEGSMEGSPPGYSVKGEEEENQMPPEPVASSSIMGNSTFQEDDDDVSTVIQQSVTFDNTVAKDKGRESIQEAHSRKMKDLFPSPYPTNTNGGVSKINNTRDVHNSEGGVSKSEGGGVSKFQHEINNSTIGASFSSDVQASAVQQQDIVQEDEGTTSGSNSTVTSSVIGTHLRQIAPSKDEYDKLKRESYELKKKHEVRHGGGSSMNKKGYGNKGYGEVGIKKKEKLSKVTSGRQLEDGLIGKSSRPSNHTRGISEAPSNVSGFTNNGLPHLLASHHSRMSSATELDDHQLLYENSELDRAYNERVAKRSIGVGQTPAGVRNNSSSAMEERQQERRSMATQTSGKKENKELFTHSTSTALITNKGMKKSNNRSSSGLYSARLGADRNSLERVNKVGKGMVKMTTESLSKIRDVLHLTNSNDDEMSFFVSDANTGEITKQKVSLDKEKTDDDDDDNKNTETTTGRELMIISASDKAARGSRLATEKRAPPQSVKKVATMARDSMDHAASQIKNGLGPALEAAARTAIAATKEGVDVMTHDVAPKIGVGIANTAKLTAKGVVKVTQQSVEGMGMIVHDLANAKTPGKSNVTTATQKMEDGRYADYVHDPNYKVVLTPPNNNNNTKNAGKTPFAYCDPLTPGCLVGAVTAGRCNLPGTHPDSLEFLPDGIPRELVVYDDWEERAGFLPTTAARVADSPKFAVEAKANVAPEDRRISHPVDIDEETTTINGDEVDVDEYVALKQGCPSPKNANNNNGQGFEAHDDEEEEEENGEVEDEEEDPRNASMWVAVPDHYMEDDDNASADNYLEKSAEEINMGDLLNDSVENEVETEEEEPLPTPESFGSGAFFVGNVQVDNDASAAHNTTTPESCGNDTFFVGDVQIGSESSPESTMNTKRINEEEEVVVEDVVSEEDDASETVVEEDTVVSPEDDASKALVDDAKSWTAPSNMEDLNVYQNRGSPPTLTQVASSSSVGEEEDSLASLAKATTAAVVNNKQQQQQEKAKEFETPHSVRKGERPLSYTEFKNMSKSVLFDLNQADKEPAVSDNDGGGENYAHQLYLNPSESTELSHEPPVRMIDSSAQQLYTNPSESTDLSQFSNWAAPAVPTATNQVKTVARQNTQRQLKGRIILVRIKKKLSKVAKKMLFIKSREKKDEIIKDGNGFVIELPNNTNAAAYPDHSSPLSISSSIMSGVPAKHTLGANPPKHGAPTPAQQYLYGTINYGNRSPDDSSTVDGSSDSLPPPPALLSSRPKTSNSEDVVSYLAEAMKRSHSNDGNDEDEEDSVLLLLTPRGDGSGEEICEVISALDGTPNLREAIDVGNEDQIANSEVKPNNLSSLFTDQKGNNNIHHYNGKPIEIMDAVEVDEGIVLTPHKVNHNVSDVFRTSIDACSILPGSHIDSEGEDEDTTLYHDGNTLIRQSSTFGDNTIATMTSALLPPTKEEEEVEKVEPKLTVKATKNEDTLGTPILSPDGLPLTHQAAANASFLFSPQNMGRADPKIRAKERLKGTKTKPSITMLPTATAKGGESALVIRQSYSSRSSSLGTNTNLQRKSKESVVASANMKMDDANNDEEKVVQTNKQPMSSMKEDRQFSFKTILNKFSTDAADGHHVSFTATAPPEEPPALPSKEEEERTPVTTNSRHPKKYPKSPFPADGAVIKSVASEDSSSPLLVSLNVGLNSPLSTTSVSSFKSNKGKKKKASPKSKKVPKSALKVRKGFVKDRVSDFHQRTSIATATSNSVPTGRLKRNHSYKTKNTRRMTNGNGVLAPRHAVLQTTYIRSVPIAIAKTYSKDSSIGNSFSFAHDEAKNNEEARAQQGIQEEEKRVSFASKQQSSSPDSVKSSSSSSDDASETTEHDPFNSLLGKVLNDDDSSDEDEVYESDIVDKENAANSPSVNLGFKSTTRTLVKPTEIKQHGDRGALSPVPMKARSWRVLAAAAKLDKQNIK